LSTWLPQRCPVDTGATATFIDVKEYLTLIEQLVREDKTEREIERIVKQAVREDDEAVEDRRDELPDAA
jgi:hypothetical protein